MLLFKDANGISYCLQVLLQKDNGIVFMKRLFFTYSLSFSHIFAMSLYVGTGLNFENVFHWDVEYYVLSTAQLLWFIQGWKNDSKIVFFVCFCYNGFYWVTKVRLARYDVELDRVIFPEYRILLGNYIHVCWQSIGIHSI